MKGRYYLFYLWWNWNLSSETYRNLPRDSWIWVFLWDHNFSLQDSSNCRVPFALSDLQFKESAESFLENDIILNFCGTLEAF